MTITTSGTTLTFNDATTQTTAPVNTNANVTSATAVAGTGISITAITTTGAATHTVTNTGVTSVTGAGTVSVSASTGGVTITGTGGSGTVTSVATGNGLSGGTITSTGTLVVACPSAGSVGSYATGFIQGSPTTNFGSNYSVGTGYNQFRAGFVYNNGCYAQIGSLDSVISGTWKWLGGGDSRQSVGVICRVS
jgi:hypothetical protein